MIDQAQVPTSRRSRIKIPRYYSLRWRSLNPFLAACDWQTVVLDRLQQLSLTPELRRALHQEILKSYSSRETVLLRGSRSLWGMRRTTRQKLLSAFHDPIHSLRPFFDFCWKVYRLFLSSAVNPDVSTISASIDTSNKRGKIDAASSSETRQAISTTTEYLTTTTNSLTVSVEEETEYLVNQQYWGLVTRQSYQIHLL